MMAVGMQQRAMSGSEFVKALGLDLDKRYITRISIDFDAYTSDGIVRVSVYEERPIEGGGGFAEVLTRYKLVPVNA